MKKPDARGARRRVAAWLDPKLEWPDEHEVWIGGMMPCSLADLRAVLAEAERCEELQRRIERLCRVIAALSLRQPVVTVAEARIVRAPLRRSRGKR